MTHFINRKWWEMQRERHMTHVMIHIETAACENVFSKRQDIKTKQG